MHNTSGRMVQRVQQDIEYALLSHLHLLQHATSGSLVLLLGRGGLAEGEQLGVAHRDVQLLADRLHDLQARVLDLQKRRIADAIGEKMYDRKEIFQLWSDAYYVRKTDPAMNIAFTIVSYRKHLLLVQDAVHQARNVFSLSQITCKKCQGTH